MLSVLLKHTELVEGKLILNVPVHENIRFLYSLNANVKSVVYCTVLRHSETEDTWQYLWNKFTQTKLASEQVLILNTLGCTRNESLLIE